jgi:Bacterial Ig domain
VRLRAIAALLAVAAVVTAGVTFSGAAFTAASADPSNGFTASNAFNLSATMTDPGAYLHATATLGATASDGEDGSSISSVKIQRSPAGAGTWTDVCTDSSSPYSCSFDTTAVGDGLYDFRAIATNNAGGTATSTAITNRRVDNTAPTAGLTNPGTPLRGTVTVDATGTDGGSGVANVAIQRSPAGAGTWTTICTDSSSPYSCSWNTTGVSDGLYDLRAVSTDNANNSTNSTVVTNRRVDNTAPTATMTNPGSPITGSKTFDGTSTDTGGSGVASLTFQVSPIGAGTWSDMCTDSSSPYSCSYNTSGLSDGQYDFRSLATDNAGNTATSTVYSGAIVDNGAPTAGVTDPGQYLKGTVTLDASGADGAGSGILNVKIQRSPAGAGTWTDICTDTTSPYQCSWNTAGVGDGLYDLRAVATDNVSLSGTSSTVTNRRVDNTAPTATMNDPGANLSGTTVSLTASATDGGSGVASVKIQRSPAGAGTWTDVCTDTTSPYSCSFDSTGVTDGLYDFRAISADNATNSTTSSTVQNRRVDNTAPTSGLTDPGSPLRGTVTVNATGTDGGSGVLNVQIQRAPTGTSTWTTICTDSSSPYSCSWNTTAVPDAGYDLRAITTDNANNVTYSSTVSNRVVDNAAPTATDIQSTNHAGGTAGQPEQGDTLVFTFSEQIAPGTIVSGWNGTGTQNVTVTMDSGNHLTITGATLVNGFVTLGGTGYVQSGKTVVFSSSTISQSGSTITLTLGSPDKPQFTQVGSAGASSWPVAAGLTDLAGNTLVTPVTKNETGGSDAEF